MAQFEMDFPENILDGLDDMIDDVAPKMINEALPIYQKSVSESIGKVLSTAPEDVKRQTGELEKSVAAKGPKQTKDGAYIGNIVFEGYDQKKSPNVLKAVALEYGLTSKIYPPRPFLDNAKNSCESDIISTMQKVFNEEVDAD